MTTKRDYYEILGISKGATADDIKKAYRNLALKYHPDRVSADKKKEAEEKFKEMSEAYEVLIDPQKKGTYDQYGHSGVDSSFKQGGFEWQDFHHFDDLKDIFGEVDISDLFRSFGMGGDVYGGSFGGGAGRRGGARRGSDLEYQIEISFDDAAFGVEKTIAIPRYEACETCGGTGAKPGSKRERCSSCGGRGQVSSSSGFFNVVRTCDRCGGEGTVIKTPCSTCGGRGRVKAKRNIKVKIPAGVDTGSRLRVSHEGEMGLHGGPRGDLYIYIYEEEHPFFKREGNDLYCEFPISFSQAALGTEVEVPTIDGTAKIKISSGTPSGRVFHLKGKGVQRLGGYGKGDQIVRVYVDVPKSLTPRQRELLEEFAHISGDEVNKSFKEKIKNLFTGAEK